MDNTTASVAKNLSSEGQLVDYRLFLTLNSVIAAVTCFGNLAFLVAFAGNKELTKNQQTDECFDY